jgi:TonB family protein
MTPLLLALKVAVVLAMALAAAALLRRRSASLRHWVLAAGIVCALALPLLALVAPAWSVSPPVRSLPPEGASHASPADVETYIVPAAGERPALPPAGGSHGPVATIELGALVLSVWAAGAALMLLAFLAGLLRLRGLVRTAVPFVDARWHAPGVRLLQSDHPALVMTWGLRTPVIVLPPDAHTWPDERIQVVLRHELAHIERGDWLVLLLAHAMRALHWFNPLAWVACRRLRQEGEHACDDAVLALGVAPPAYAAHLLDLARASAARTREWAPALPIARPSGLERRVHAMLNGDLNRRPVTLSARAAVVFAFLVVSVAAAGVGAAQGGFSTVAGALTDPSGAALPGVTLSVTNTATETITTLRTTRAGHFEFVGLPPGQYRLEATVPGFRQHRESLTLDGQLVQRDITMQIGQVEEFITISGAANASPRPPVEYARKEPRPCNAAPVAADGPRIGGNIRPPVKLRDVRPLYPPALRDAKVGGVVRIETKIATDGTVRDMKPVPGEHPDLVRAAMDAVAQWQFAETLLNCQPIEIDMTVRIAFDPAA